MRQAGQQCWNGRAAHRTPSAASRGAHLLGRLQAPHIRQVLQALPHHRALKGYQHEQREERIVPAGAGRLHVCAQRQPAQGLTAAAAWRAIGAARHDGRTSSRPAPTGRHRTPGSRRTAPAAAPTAARRSAAPAPQTCWGPSAPAPTQACPPRRIRCWHGTRQMSPAGGARRRRRWGRQATRRWPATTGATRGTQHACVRWRGWHLCGVLELAEHAVAGIQDEVQLAEIEADDGTSILQPRAGTARAARAPAGQQVQPGKPAAGAGVPGPAARCAHRVLAVQRHDLLAAHECVRHDLDVRRVGQRAHGAEVQAALQLHRPHGAQVGECLSASGDARQRKPSGFSVASARRQACAGSRHSRAAQRRRRWPAARGRTAQSPRGPTAAVPMLPTPRTAPGRARRPGGATCDLKPWRRRVCGRRQRRRRGGAALLQRPTAGLASAGWSWGWPGLGERTAANCGGPEMATLGAHLSSFLYSMTSCSSLASTPGNRLAMVSARPRQSSPCSQHLRGESGQCDWTDGSTGRAMASSRIGRRQHVPPPAVAAVVSVRTQ